MIAPVCPNGEMERRWKAMSLDNTGWFRLPPPGKEKAKHKRGTRKSAHKGLRVRVEARVLGWEIPA